MHQSSVQCYVIDAGVANTLKHMYDNSLLVLQLANKTNTFYGKRTCSKFKLHLLYRFLANKQIIAYMNKL